MNFLGGIYVLHMASPWDIFLCGGEVCFSRKAEVTHWMRVKKRIKFIIFLIEHKNFRSQMMKESFWGGEVCFEIINDIYKIYL